jgi:hypothetical protein
MQGFVESLKGIDLLEDLVVYGRMILKFIWKELYKLDPFGSFKAFMNMIICLGIQYKVGKFCNNLVKKKVKLSL